MKIETCIQKNTSKMQICDVCGQFRDDVPRRSITFICNEYRCTADFDICKSCMQDIGSKKLQVTSESFTYERGALREILKQQLWYEPWC